MKQIIGITFTYLIFLSACALNTQTIFLYAKADPSYTFTPSKQIYVALPEPQNLQAKEFRKLLVTEMTQLGFNMIHQLNSDALVLFFSQISDSTAVLSLPNSGAISRLPAQWHQINLEIFSLNELRRQGPIWEGTLKVRRREFKARPVDATRSLLQLIGKNFEDSIPIQTASQFSRKLHTTNTTQLRSQVQTLEDRVKELEKMPTKPKPYDSFEHPTTSSALPPEHVDHINNIQKAENLKSHTDNSIDMPVSIDTQSSTESYERSCAKQDGNACTNLGLLYYQGLGITRNLQRAQFYFALGCHYHNKVACTLQKTTQ